MIDSHKIELGLEVKHLDENGNIKYNNTIFSQDTSENTVRIETDKDNISFPMKSFNRNLAAMFHIRAFSATSSAFTGRYILNTSGSYASSSYATVFAIGRALFGSPGGISVGTGSNTASILNYNLNYKVNHGTSENTLYYALQNWTAPYSSGSTYEFSTERTFYNMASSSITVTEVAMTKDDTYLLTYDTITVSGSAISIAVETGSALKVYNYFSIGSGSFLNKNFLNCFYSALADTTMSVTTSTNQTDTTNFSVGSRWRIMAGNTQDATGIVVGTGSNVLNLDDYNLGGQAMHGTGNNQIYYLTTFINDYPTVQGTSSVSHSISRTFVNKSDTPIALSEAGIYIGGSGSAYTQDNAKVMIARTLIDPTITLNPLESIFIRYLFIYKA